MSISVACPCCRKTLALSDDLAGKRIRCNQCREPLRVPDVEAIRPTASVEEKTRPARQPAKVESSRVATSRGKQPLPRKAPPRPAPVQKSAASGRAETGRSKKHRPIREPDFSGVGSFGIAIERPDRIEAEAEAAAYKKERSPEFDRICGELATFFIGLGVILFLLGGVIFALMGHELPDRERKLGAIGVTVLALFLSGGLASSKSVGSLYFLIPCSFFFSVASGVTVLWIARRASSPGDGLVIMCLFGVVPLSFFVSLFRIQKALNNA